LEAIYDREILSYGPCRVVDAPGGTCAPQPIVVKRLVCLLMALTCRSGQGRAGSALPRKSDVDLFRYCEPGVPYCTALSAAASEVDGTVSPSCFCGLEVDREREFGDLIEGDLSRVCAVQDGVSGFELEVVKMLQGYVIGGGENPAVGSVAGFAGDIGAVQTRQDISTILQYGPSRRGRIDP
jgi:hypothetical protein